MNLKRIIKDRVKKKFGYRDDYGLDEWEEEMDFAIGETVKELKKK